MAVCTENLDTNVVVMKPAEETGPVVVEMPPGLERFAPIRCGRSGLLAYRPRNGLASIFLMRQPHLERQRLLSSISPGAAKG